MTENNPFVLPKFDEVAGPKVDEKFETPDEAFEKEATFDSVENAPKAEPFVELPVGDVTKEKLKSILKDCGADSASQLTGLARIVAVLEGRE